VVALVGVIIAYQCYRWKKFKEWKAHQEMIATHTYINVFAIPEVSRPEPKK
jgi:hypothetical protein